ncbi:MAG TPA: VOC family protein [Halococcus sp.]|nr:VOC family protein [Halococcus sp.]
MNEENFQVEQIDHVELVVPDRYEAAQWYEQVLGLEICDDYQQWADDGGPLHISSDGGKTKLALFEGQPSGSRETTGSRRVAFRVGGTEFIDFITRVEDLPVPDVGREEDQDDIADHDLAFSIYFQDPYGNPLEVTTYDYETVATALKPE